MEDRPGVAFTLRSLCQFNEILGGLGHSFSKQSDDDAADLLITDSDIEPNLKYDKLVTACWK
jgi:hypothetical protein